MKSDIVKIQAHFGRTIPGNVTFFSNRNRNAKNLFYGAHFLINFNQLAVYLFTKTGFVGNSSFFTEKAAKI